MQVGPHRLGGRTGTAGGSQICGGNFPANACFLFDPAQALAKLAERDHLLLASLHQDIARVDGAYRSALDLMS